MNPQDRCQGRPTREPDPLLARRVLVAALALVLPGMASVAGAAGRTHGATLLVDNCNDAGPGSLRDVVALAASGDLVDASALACTTISLSTGAIAIAVDDLAVRGPGRDRLLVTNGAKYGRVFRHEGTGTLNLYGLTISSGTVSPNADEAGSAGGCIYSAGSVNLGDFFNAGDATRGVVVRDCTAVSTAADVAAEGGGIFAMRGVGLVNSVVTQSRAIAQDRATISSGGGIAVRSGPFAMKYSEVSDCSASGPTGFAGGVHAPFTTSVLVSHSTIAGNTASGRAGGAYLGTDNGATLDIDNSTVSGNSSTGEGGLVLNVLSGSVPGQIRIRSSTITANVAADANASGGALVAGPALLESTIASGNLGGNAPFDLHLTAAASGSDNLVGVVAGTPPPDGLVVTLDPALGPLANHGGRTRTQVPLAGSAAVDAGNNSAGSDSDQRGPGFARTLGARTDIGAVERDPDRLFTNGFD